MKVGGPAIVLNTQTQHTAAQQLVLLTPPLAAAVVFAAATQEWLCTEGSPHSHIERCEFKQERDLDQLQFDTFERRPNVP
jgi:hypothetical protein